MNPTSRLLVAAAFGACFLIAPSAASSDLRPAVVTNPSGSMHMVQVIPCNDHIDESTPVTAGRIAITPAEGFNVGSAKRFTLSRVNASFAPFTIDKSCFGFGETRNYTRLSVQLAGAVSFTSEPSAPGVYPFVIPKGSFTFYEAAIVNGDPETKYVFPSRDVTGRIDLNTGAFSLHVVSEHKLHFRAGCVATCLIDEEDDGSLTVDLSGTLMFPDADSDGVPDRSDNCKFVPNPDQTPVPTPTIVPPRPITLNSCLDHRIGIAVARDVCDGGPITTTNDAPAQFSVGPNTVTWTARDSKNRTASAEQIVTVVDTTKPAVACTATHPLGRSFVVTAGDACGVPALTLGRFTIANGEQIKIEVTGRPGVRLQNVINGIRTFQVGKGENVILATDGSGNTTTAVCR